MKKWHYVLALALVCFLVYFNSLQGTFVTHDDLSILNNPSLTSFNSPSFDIPTLLYKSAYKIGGWNPVPFHAINIIFHIVNTILVFIFLSLFFKERSSFLGALLFAVHPIHTEAVTWISGISYLILGFFIFASYLLYHKAVTGKLKVSYYILSLTMFLYGMIYLNKGFYMVFPFLLLLSDWYFNRTRMKNFFLRLPYFAIVVAAFIFFFSALEKKVTGNTFNVALNWMNKADTPFALLVYEAQWKNLWAYISYSIINNFRLLIHPVNLTFYHEPVLIFIQAILQYLDKIYFIFLGLFIFAFKKRFIRITLFIIAFYLLFLIPTFLPREIAIGSIVAERYLYVPSIVLSFCVCAFFDRISKGRMFFLIAFSILLFLCSLLTIRRNLDYKSFFNYWKITVENSPKSHRAHNDLGLAYIKAKGDYAKAVKEFTRAIHLDPTFSLGIYNLKKALKKQGKDLLMMKYDRQKRRWTFYVSGKKP